jgi:hypothetical protein
VAALGLPGHLGQQGKPAAQQLADRFADLAVGPSRGDRLLQDPHIAGVQVVLEVVAGLLVALPQRQILGIHALLAGQAALILLLEQGQNQALLGAEVVVELAERHPGLLGHLAGRQARVAVGQQPAPRRVKDECAGVHARAAASVKVGRSTDPSLEPCSGDGAWLRRIIRCGGGRRMLAPLFSDGPRTDGQREGSPVPTRRRTLAGSPLSKLASIPGTMVKMRRPRAPER